MNQSIDNLCEKIPSLKSGFYNELVSAYLSGEPKLSTLYQHSPSLGSFRPAIQAKSESYINRELLCNTLRTQYSHIRKIPENVRQNIDALEQPNTFSITTGHQLSLLTGPLYFVYKILSVVSLCRSLLQEYPEHQFVPVFWMATEDHDYDEIKSVYLKGRYVRFESEVGEDGPCGRIPSASVARELAMLTDQFPELNLNAYWKIFITAYAEGPTLAHATRRIVTEIFGVYGVVCIDGDDLAFKKHFSAIVQRDIPEANSVRLLAEGDRTMVQAGFSPQAMGRKVNFFYMDGHQRERFVFENNMYGVHNTPMRFTADEMQQLISNHPEKFSPNVITRPLYQEFLLPNIAYVGGPAEVHYWLQLKRIFDFYEVPYPIVIPRDNFIVLSRRKWEKYKNLTGSESISRLFMASDKLIQAYTDDLMNDKKYFSEETEHLRQIFSDVIDKIGPLDTSLQKSADAAGKKALKSLERLELIARRQVRRNHEETIRFLIDFNLSVFPEGVFQERIQNVLEFSGLFENRFLDKVLMNSDPLAMEIKVLLYD